MSRYTWELADWVEVTFLSSITKVVHKIEKPGVLVCLSFDNPAGLSYRFWDETVFHFIPMHRIRKIEWQDIKIVEKDA